MIKKFLKGLKITMITTLIGVMALGLGIMLFVRFAPQFGARPSGEHLQRISQSEHYQNGQFVNLTETILDYSLRSISESIWELFTAANTAPTLPLPVQFGENESDVAIDSLTHITWFGHSAFLLEMEGKRLLLDPMFGPAASPVSFITRRFSYEKPIDINDFTNIDAVIISHDHYDHLDYSSIIQLKDEVAHFFVPLGVGSHLIRWGVAAEKITELDWWESARLDHLNFTATPARHFSGRGLTDSKKTLWASWVLRGAHSGIYFSGDSGYGPHFKAISQKLGPFDFAMMECGQYNEKWEAIHMMPEQTAQAAVDIGTEVMMPIHWGAFTLAPHTWTDPITRLLKAAETRNISVIHPVIGARFTVGNDFPKTKWWKK